MVIKYSVIIPVYNTILECKNIIDNFHGVLNKRSDIEFIIIDDGSFLGDSSKKFKDEFVRYIYQDNSGVSCARNKGIELALGEYVLFWDSDDEFSNDCFDILDSYTEDNIDFIAMSYKKTFIDLSEKFYNNKTMILNKSDYIKLILNKETCLNICATTIKRNIIVDNNIRFDNNITHCEDVLFLFKCLSYSEKIIQSYFLIFNYLYRDNSAMNARMSINNFSLFSALDKIKNEINCYDKHLVSYYIKTHCVLFVISLLRKTNYSDEFFYKYIECYNSLELPSSPLTCKKSILIDIFLFILVRFPYLIKKSQKIRSLLF